MIINNLIKSDTWGVCAGLSFDYYPRSWLSIGINADLMFARLINMHLSTEKTEKTIALGRDDYEYLTRLDYSLAFRFHFNLNCKNKIK